MSSFSGIGVWYPLKNLFSPHKIRGKKDKEKNRNPIAALLHLSHDKSLWRAGCGIRQTTEGASPFPHPCPCLHCGRVPQGTGRGKEKGRDTRAQGKIATILERLGVFFTGCAEPCHARRMSDPGRKAEAGEGTCLSVANLKEGGALEKTTWGKVVLDGISD